MKGYYGELSAGLKDGVVKEGGVVDATEGAWIVPVGGGVSPIGSLQE